MWVSQNLILHHQNPYSTQFHWSESTNNDISLINCKTAAILCHFRSCYLCGVVKIEFCIIKTPILPSLIGLIALEMIFPEFITKRRPFLTICGHVTYLKYYNSDSASSKNPILPSFIGLIVLEMIFPEFIPKQWPFCTTSGHLTCVG